jgi:hypothetical protein
MAITPVPVKSDVLKWYVAHNATDHHAIVDRHASSDFGNKARLVPLVVKNRAISHAPNEGRN